jgi:hypothetical protein
MTIKDLFSKKAAISNSAISSSALVESPDFVRRKIESNQRFLPHIDFSTASNFVKFGSAEQHYATAIERIYGEYPYDGSEKEKLEFRLSSSALDLYVLDQRYPTSTGYAILSADGWGSLNGTMLPNGYGLPVDLEYISIQGSPHTASQGMDASPLYQTFDDSVRYDYDKNRINSLRMNFSSGSTIEFWLKKNAFDVTKSKREVIFDLWNGELSSSDSYGRMIIELTGAGPDVSGADPFRITLMSGTVGYATGAIGSTITTSSLGDWNHFAFTFQSQSANIMTRFYVNGEENTSSSFDLAPGTGTWGINEITGTLNAYMGALITPPSGNIFTDLTMVGAGKLSGSVDDFRYWQTARTSEQIKNNYYTHVGGGANSDDYTTDLGLYYKFNEGIVGSASIDSTVLDYSGRICNGVWTGYDTYSRNTGSAMVSSSFTEIEDPIIYLSHSSVSTVVDQMQITGSEWDNTNPSYLYRSFPFWMRAEDDSSTNDLRNISHILGAYFDDLYSKISAVKDLKNKTYISSSNKPYPFSYALLEEKGFITSEIFTNSNILERFGNRDASAVQYEKEVEETKNLIYTNIYNNIEHIYKTKGTQRSLRNFMRCFGVDDELVKLNVYTDEGTHYFTDKNRRTSVKKKFINFQKPDYSQATIYQNSSSLNANTFIGYAHYSKHSAFTAEAGILVPHKLSFDKTGSFDTPFLSSSIFGIHEANASTAGDYTWDSSDTGNFQVYLVRDERNSRRAKFVLENTGKSIFLESDYYDEIYDNNYWTVAVSVRPDTYEIATTASSPTYTLEFYGVNYNFDDIRHEFNLTSALNNATGYAYVSAAKRLYAGAHCTNYTGSVRVSSDIKLGSVRYWMDYLEPSIIQKHTIDMTNYGSPATHQSPTIFADQLSNAHVPSYDTLALNWDFDTVTGSDAGGYFGHSAGGGGAEDLSSGSTDTQYGWIDTVIRREHMARGKGFGANNTSFVDNEYIFTSKKELPEISLSSDQIYIKGDEEVYLSKDDDVSDNFYLLEKSLYQVVSEEMLNSFSSVVQFNNLIGKAEDRYRSRYKNLDYIRRMFFEKVASNLDYDAFTEYYKWIDSSISKMIQQLFPASVRFGDGVANIVESHILERNKYQNKFPLLTRHESTEGQIKGVSELNYNWKFGHSPEYKDKYYNTRAIEISKEADYLTLPVDASLNAGTNEAFTFAFWGYFSSTMSGTKIVFKFGNERQIEYDVASTALDIKLKFGATLYTWQGPHGQFATNTWHHITITFDGNRTASAVKIYKNGTALSSCTIASAPSSGTAAEISTTSNFGYELVGKLDEISYWSAALDASAASAVYSSGVPYDLTTHANASNLVSYWRMGDHDRDPEDAVYKGSIIYDSKGSNNLTGFINNSAGAVIEYVSPNANGALLRGQITNQHCAWQKNRKERADIGGLNTIKDVVTGETSGSLPILSEADRTSYQGSAYATRRFARPYSFSAQHERNIHGGVNFDGQRNKDLLLNAIHPHGPIVSDGSSADGAPRNLIGIGIGQGKGMAPIIDCEDVIDPNKKEKFNLEVIIGKNSDDASNQPLSDILGYEFKVKSELVLPFNVVSGNLNSGYNAEVYTGFDRDAVLTNLHSDVTTMNNEIPMQGPFTEGWVGGHQSRHAEINSGEDTISTRGEAFRLVFNEHGSEAVRDGAIGLTGPDYGANYPDVDRAIASHYRGNRAKRPLNITNIQYNTGSRRYGNYKENYEIISTAGRKENNIFLRRYSGDLLPAQLINDLPATTNVDTLIAKEAGGMVGNVFGYIGGSGLQQPMTYDRQILDHENTGSNSVIVNRFSAPGGPEINSLGYLDVASAEYSVHNALPFRNLSVRGSGSGESGAIRVDDHLGLRRGHKTLLREHSGQFGSDYEFGSVVSTNYVTSPSFHKINRNRLRRIELTSTGTASFGTGSVYNNGYITSPIPASEFNYAWIDNIVEKDATYASPAPATNIFQEFLGYAPRSGIISSSVGFDSAMTFPSSSQLYGTET